MKLPKIKEQKTYKENPFTSKSSCIELKSNTLIGKYDIIIDSKIEKKISTSKIKVIGKNKLAEHLATDIVREYEFPKSASIVLAYAIKKMNDNCLVYLNPEDMVRELGYKSRSTIVTGIRALLTERKNATILRCGTRKHDYWVNPKLTLDTKIYSTYTEYRLK